MKTQKRIEDIIVAYVLHHRLKEVWYFCLLIAMTEEDEVSVRDLALGADENAEYVGYGDEGF